MKHENDAPERTLAEVLGVLDKAILKAWETELNTLSSYEPIDDHFFNELEKIGG